MVKAQLTTNIDYDIVKNVEILAEKENKKKSEVLSELLKESIKRRENTDLNKPEKIKIEKKDLTDAYSNIAQDAKTGDAKTGDAKTGDSKTNSMVDIQTVTVEKSPKFTIKKKDVEIKPDLSILDNLILDVKDKSLENKGVNKNVNKSVNESIFITKKQPRFPITKDDKLNIKKNKGEKNMPEETVSAEEAFNKLMEKQESKKTLLEMNSRIKGLCEDGKCIKDELIGLKKDVIDLRNIKKDLEKLNDLDNLKKDIKEIREKDFGDIKGKLKKTEICPECGFSEVTSLSSFCPNCGIGFHGWTDEHGNPIKEWKPYPERVKK